jgi:diguanylate cyclase (GGDEF)-like protein/PAS domain S-box-containing protein
VGALLGREPAVLLGQPILGFIHRDDRAHVQQALDGLREGRPARAEYRVRGPNNDWIWLESTASSLLDDPDVQGIIAVSRDVTERHRTTEVLAHRAAHDPLTGLANRAELEHRLQGALHHAIASGEPLSVAYLDVDGFKPVNDSHGHAAGDDLLRRVAEALRGQVRDGDLIARVGGDEFVVVLPGVDRSAARATAERIRLQLAQPMAIDGPAEPVRVTASIGLAWAVASHTVASLLRDADQALYEAKRRGRDRIEVARGGVDARDLVEELIEQASAPTGPG